ncbi:MAG: 4-alpha-glucanotransferase, partial [Chlamydiae bacterium]|nr:4-alpha-glucanotransferase [Chlamydiota bacterium]
VDVWYYPDNFILDFRAGAPPDKYNPEGQNWGFPLFNWHVVKKQDYYFWKQRMEYAHHFYDVFRIDHVLGFFRIWSVLKDCDPKLGRFTPSNETVWEEHGRSHLNKIISLTTMLPIAEDLGVVPSCVGPVLTDLGICGTKVMRWERNYGTDESVIPINEYPRLSMTTISTHDSPTLAQWWRDFPEEVSPYCKYKDWEYEKEISQQQRLSILRDSHNTSSLFHINLLQEYLSLVPELSWEDIDQDRINIPGKILDTNWTYRFKTCIKKIINNVELKEFFSFILKK